VTHGGSVLRCARHEGPGLITRTFTFSDPSFYVVAALHRDDDARRSASGEFVRTKRSAARADTNESEPPMTCRKRRDAIETGLQSLVRDEARGEPVDCPSDGRHGGGVSPVQALMWNVGTCCLDAKGDLQVVDP
jgi:hypothetical protein